MRAAPPTPVVIPVAVTRREDGLLLDWDGAGHVAFYPARALRLECPCAQCVEEMTGRRLLRPETVPEGISPRAVTLVGAYGIQITWSDGHGTGIYVFDRLLAACPCDRCGKTPA